MTQNEFRCVMGAINEKNRLPSFVSCRCLWNKRLLKPLKTQHIISPAILSVFQAECKFDLLLSHFLSLVHCSSASCSLDKISIQSLYSMHVDYPVFFWSKPEAIWSIGTEMYAIFPVSPPWLFSWTRLWHSNPLVVLLVHYLVVLNSMPNNSGGIALQIKIRKRIFNIPGHFQHWWE